jgi:hypothetical protein
MVGVPPTWRTVSSFVAFLLVALCQFLIESKGWDITKCG